MMPIRSVKFYIILVLALVQGSVTHTEAQNVRLEGSVIDSTSTPLIGATVVLLQSQDSIMAAYGISGTKGNFVLSNVMPGKYFLQITYLGYGNFRQVITVQEGPMVQDVGIIFLSPSNTLLEEVVVKAEHVPVMLADDTIIYNADAFRTEPNAVVEDLLKRLPGIEVKRDGSIKAQGEDVDRVLVDGKEFFGNDPKIATQNLPAEIVDKVQVYDKQSEMAEFSGIDDGMEEKTINLELKADSKQGYFGSVEGGGGSGDLSDFFNEDRSKGKLTLNRFDSKMQVSLLGMANNTNEAGFSFNDYINFMGGIGSFMSGGNLSLNINAGDLGLPMGMEQPGITTTHAGGLNFNMDISDHIEWQSSYFFNRINNDIIQRSNSENALGEDRFQVADEVDQNTLNLNHRLNTSLKWRLDSTTQLLWTNRLSFNTGDTRSQNASSTFSQNDTPRNSSLARFMSDGSQDSWNTDLTLRKKLNKDGRVVTGNVNFNVGNNSRDARTDSSVDFFMDGQQESRDVILQDQNSDEDIDQYGFGLTYTEPLSNKSFLGINASSRNYNNERTYNYFDIDPEDPSSRVKNVELSNHFVRGYTVNRSGISWRYVGSKLKSSLALDYQNSGLTGDIISENVLLEKNFWNILPSLNMEYELGSSKSLQFDYRTRIQEPALDQLQPAIVNSDPLYTYTGNPELRPEYIHRGSLHLMLFDQFTFTSFFANLNAEYARNKIVNKTFVDESFRQITTPVNTENALNTGLYTSFETPLRFIKSKIALDANMRYERGRVFINELENITNRWTNNFTFTIENRKKNVIDVLAGFSLGMNDISYSLSAANNINYFDQTYFTDLNLYLPGDWTFQASLDYTRYSGERFGMDNQQAILRASLSRTFLEKDRGTLKLSVFDVLNQSRGIARTNNLNYVRETISNVLGRYFLVSFHYKLSQFGDRGSGMQFDVRDRR